ncbi:MAG: nucleotidyltransferase domain-containing protein [Candidatus Bipolaricaulota bacterium]|nr:nucleotidyltransferase domain-containing protein [Candidatus Bipolaricaulota bacterium]
MTERRRFSLDSHKRQGVVQPIVAQLAQRPEILAIVLYGSFLNKETFRDIDLALLVDEQKLSPERFLDYELELLEELARLSQFPLDIRIVNRAPVLFRYAVTQGQLLFYRDGRLWVEFCERTWGEYLDFEPVARLYIKELAHGRDTA